MAIDFQLSALPLAPFVPLFSLTDAALEERGARRCIADVKPGYQCRVSLLDAEPGERLILLPFTAGCLLAPAQCPSRVLQLSHRSREESGIERRGAVRAASGRPAATSG